MGGVEFQVGQVDLLLACLEGSVLTVAMVGVAN